MNELHSRLVLSRHGSANRLLAAHPLERLVLEQVH